MSTASILGALLVLAVCNGVNGKVRAPEYSLIRLQGVQEAATQRHTTRYRVHNKIPAKYLPALQRTAVL